MEHEALLLVLNGDPPNRLLRSLQEGGELPRHLLQTEHSLRDTAFRPCIMAADGAARHLHEAGLQIDFLVGDLDSTPPDLVEQLRGTACQVHQVEDQEHNDLEKCLSLAREMRFETIWIAGFEGSRLDMTLGLYSLLAGPQARNILLCGRYQLSLPLEPGTFHFATQPGERISLVNVSGRPLACDLSGLAWSGRGVNIGSGCHGVSNRALAHKVQVRVSQRGLLLVRDLWTQ